MDFEILAQQFYEESQFINGYTQATIRRYKYVLSSYQRYSGIRNINEITVDNVRALFLYGRTQKHWQVNTFLVFHKSLKVFFNWLVKRSLLASNPVVEIELPKLEKRLLRGLPKNEAIRLLEVVLNYPYENEFQRYRNHAIFSTYVFAGLRLHELLNLRVTDVDLENRTIFVNQGKGSKDRMVPISFPLAQSLKRYAAERKKAGKTCPELFASTYKNMSFTQVGLRRLVIQIRKASGIKFSIHTLRHTFATLMLEGGCDIYVLSQLLGHSNIVITTLYLSASAGLMQTHMAKHPLNNANTTKSSYNVVL